MLVFLLILVMLRFVVLRNVDPTHWSRVGLSIVVDVCMFITIGPILGTIWIIFRLWLVYRVIGPQRKVDKDDVIQL